MADKLDIFTAIAKRMDWLGQRHRVLAENIANSDTPNFIPKDLSESDFRRLLRPHLRPVEPVVTHARHLRGTVVHDGPARAARQRHTYETSPAGNAVVLEEQLIKVTKTQGAYQTMTNLYRKHVDMFRTALRSGG
ncbi:MAG: flagellar basal body rod protein FlgB [Alphaproteobacteria bacterium]|nr:MAG: flagellar basal body rod protein FlgB [Alphaproteobacteria bacterium]